MDMDEGARTWLLRTSKKHFWRVAQWYDLDDVIQDGYLHWYRIINKYSYITKPRMTRHARRMIMGLFQRTFTNHLHDLAKMRCPDILEPTVVEVTASLADIRTADEIMDRSHPKSWRKSPGYREDRDRLAIALATVESQHKKPDKRRSIECRMTDLLPDNVSEESFLDSLTWTDEDVATFMVMLDQAPRPVKRVLELFASEEGRRSMRNPRFKHRDETTNERLCRLLGYDPKYVDLVARVTDYFEAA